MRELRSADPFVRFIVTVDGERVAVWARTQEHAERFAAERLAVEASDAEEAGSYDERRTCAHHGVVDCETCRERDLEARGT